MKHPRPRRTTPAVPQMERHSGPRPIRLILLELLEKVRERMERRAVRMRRP